MLFHAMMEFCLDLLRLKCWLIGEWSIGVTFLIGRMTEVLVPDMLLSLEDTFYSDCAFDTCS